MSYIHCLPYEWSWVIIFITTMREEVSLIVTMTRSKHTPLPDGHTSDGLDLWSSRTDSLPLPLLPPSAQVLSLLLLEWVMMANQYCSVCVIKWDCDSMCGCDFKQTPLPPITHTHTFAFPFICVCLSLSICLCLSAFVCLYQSVLVFLPSCPPACQLINIFSLLVSFYTCVHRLYNDQLIRVANENTFSTTRC